MSTQLLPPREAERLVSVLSLLASPVPGEVVAAASAASRMLEARGITWRQLILAPTVCCDAPDRAPGDWMSLVEMARSRPALLSAWECAFVASVARQGRITAKQRAVLERLADRARAK